MLDRYYINEVVRATVDSHFENDILLQLFSNFTYETATLKIEQGRANTIIIGDVEAPNLPHGWGLILWEHHGLM